MALQLTNEEKALFVKEITSAKEEIEELKSLMKVNNKVQSILIDDVEDLKTHTGYYNALEKKDS